jgi:hypothetical protein
MVGGIPFVVGVTFHREAAAGLAFAAGAGIAALDGAVSRSAAGRAMRSAGPRTGLVW